MHNIHKYVSVIKKEPVEIHSRKAYNIFVKDIFVRLLMPLLQVRRVISSPLFMRVTRIRATIRQSLPRLSVKFPNELGPDNLYHRPLHRITLHDSLQFPTINWFSWDVQIRFTGIRFCQKTQFAVNMLTARLMMLNDVNCNYLIDFAMQVSY